MPDTFELAAVVGRIIVWYAAMTEPKPECFTCGELVQQLGMTMHQLHTPLILLGWHRAEVWHRANGKRVRRVFYAPPGQQVPRPPRGRPRFRLEDFCDINYQ